MAHEILIVDDEPDIRLLIEGLLADEGYATRSAGSAEEALAAFRERRPSLVILDVWLQNSAIDGLEVLDVLRREDATLPVVMISGHGTIEMAVSAIHRGAYDFIEKPFKADRLLLVVRRALEAARLAAENAELRLRAGPESELIGSSPAIEALRQAIARVAPTGSRVLITGAPGWARRSPPVSSTASRAAPRARSWCSTARPSIPPDSRRSSSAPNRRATGRA